MDLMGIMITASQDTGHVTLDNGRIAGDTRDQRAMHERQSFISFLNAKLRLARTWPFRTLRAVTKCQWQHYSRGRLLLLLRTNAEWAR